MKKDFSLQLWSIKDETQKDFKEALKFVSECGYKGVEFAGFGNLTAEEMKATLDKNKLYSIGSHTSFDLCKTALTENLEYNRKIGSKYMIIPYVSFETEEDVENLIKILNESAKIAKDYGITIGYHNHNQEFEKFNGKYILDMIAEGTTDDVILELDIYWIAKAGEDPYSYIKKHGQKVKIIHIKQIDEKGENSICSEGILDIKKIVKVSKYAEHFIVEQEGQADKRQACIDNINYLKSL